MVCKMSNRSPVDQLLPLVVRSNASPNAWPVLASIGFFLCAFATSVHADTAAVPAEGLSWLICSVSTACVMVSAAIMDGVVLVSLVCPVRVFGGKAQVVLLLVSTVEVRFVVLFVVLRSRFISGLMSITAGFVLCIGVSVSGTALGMSFISLLGVL